jgi:uncharacterized protein
MSDDIRVEIFQNNESRVIELLNQGAYVNDCDECGTLLHRAVFYDSIKCLNVLLDYGADPNVKDILGHTPLFNATRMRHTDCVSILLNRGADCYIQDNRGHRAFEYVNNRTDVESLKIKEIFDIYMSPEIKEPVDIN